MNNRVVKGFLDIQYLNKVIPINVPMLPILIFLPYLGARSVQRKKKFYKCLGNIYHHIEFRFLFQSAKPIEDSFPFKNSIPNPLFSSVIYKFTCSSYKAMVNTSWHFIVRCREHLGINNKGKTIKGVSSSIRDLFSSTGHSAFVEGFCLLDNASNELDLLIHESLLIHRDRPILKQRNSSMPLCPF